jgi:hypothetical protein
MVIFSILIFNIDMHMCQECLYLCSGKYVHTYTLLSDLSVQKQLSTESRQIRRCREAIAKK